MARTPSTEDLYEGDGVTAVFQFHFPYLHASDVFVSVDDANVTFTLLPGSIAQVQLLTPPPDGSIVKVYRSTLAYVPEHLFASGVPFLPRYVDENNRQLLYASQEAINDTAGTAADALAKAEAAIIIAERAEQKVDDAIFDTAAALRGELQDVIDPLQGVNLIGRAVVAVASMKELLTMPQRTDQIFQLMSWHMLSVYPAMRGGAPYIWLPNLPRSMHDGGYFVSPTVPFDGTLAGVRAFLAGVGETAPTANGVFAQLAVKGQVIWAESYGLAAVSGYLWNCASFQAAIKRAWPTAADPSPSKVNWLPGTYDTTMPIVLNTPDALTTRLPGFFGPGRYNSTIRKNGTATAGVQYGVAYDLDCAVMEIPHTTGDTQAAGAFSGGFSLAKVTPGVTTPTGYGYFAKRSYAGIRKDMAITGFNVGFSTKECWMCHASDIWCRNGNWGFELSSTSNFGSNLYSSGNLLGGFDLTQLIYSQLGPLACDDTGVPGGASTIAYKFNGTHGNSLVCGIEKHVGTEFDFTASYGNSISGHSASSIAGSGVFPKVRSTSSTAIFKGFNWNLTVAGAVIGQYILQSRDAASVIDYEACNFGSLEAGKYPQVLDGRQAGSILTGSYRHIQGTTFHTMALSDGAFRQCVYVGSSGRIKLAACVANAASDAFVVPTDANGVQVSAVSTSAGSPTSIGTLWVNNIAQATTLQAYVSNGWLYAKLSAGGANRDYNFVWHGGAVG